MSTIALFSGQGSQYPGMGLDLVEQNPELKSIYDTASAVLGFDLYELIRTATPEELSRTCYAQPAIMATSLVCLEAAKKKGFTFDAVAGHSLGEYAAMVASGMLTLEQGFRVIKERAAAMEPVSVGSMAAIIKLDAQKIEEICEATEGYVVPANYNSTVQTVIAGDKEAVAKASEACAALKARAVPLAVAGAFHTALMEPAAETFYQAIQDVKFAEPNVTFYSNVLGSKRTDFSDMPGALRAHMVSPVRFTAELAEMQADGIDRYVEFGPKTVLSGLVKKTLKGVTIQNVENAETLEGVVGA